MIKRPLPLPFTNRESRKLKIKIKGKKKIKSITKITENTLLLDRPINNKEYISCATTPIFP